LRAEAVIRSYRDLRVWSAAMDLVTSTYKVSKKYPKDELYGLTSQSRRAAVSVPSNIAEGHGRKHVGEYLHHLSIANGSLMELETQVRIAFRLEYLNTDEQDALLRRAADVGRMLAGLITSLRKRR